MQNNILIELPVPFRVKNGVTLVEAQAFNGISLWLNNFDAVTLCAPVLPEYLVDTATNWKCIDDLPSRARLEIVYLPWGYMPNIYYGKLRKVKVIFADLIPRHRYLLFSNLGWLGGWGSVASSIARKKGRAYSVWLDWVLHEVAVDYSASLSRRLWSYFKLFMTKRVSIESIKYSSLGLFHGRSVYDGYSKYCSNPQVVHNIHLGIDDVVSDDVIRARYANDKRIFNIVYVGRVCQMKGPFEWIEIVEKLSKMGGEIEVKATWLGDGQMLELCRNLVSEKKLDEVISFPGVESDRSKVLSFLRAGDIFLQCHLTPESPRCLIEALMSGLPLFGFSSAYAQDLVHRHPSAGIFSPVGDVNDVVSKIAKIIGDNSTVLDMAISAKKCGSNFSDVAVFSHRSALIKKFI